MIRAIAKTPKITARIVRVIIHLGRNGNNYGGYIVPLRRKGLLVSFDHIACLQRSAVLSPLLGFTGICSSGGLLGCRMKSPLPAKSAGNGAPESP
jgi:hypothetical protein